MQSYSSPSAVGYGAEPGGGGQYAQNHMFSVPTQNSFAPLQEWVGYSMGVQAPGMGSETNLEPEQMEIQWIPVRNKRRRFNTGSPAAGTGQINFSTLNVDDKLSQMFEKLNSLERSNNEIMKISQQLNSVQAKIDSAERRTVNHDLFLKVLAYKSIDLEARSRRCNLVFHGLSESKNENLSDVMRDFIWYEIGIDSDDLYIHRFHRLGSLFKAKQRNGVDNPKRPVIVAFQDYQSTEKILNSSYMLRGSGYSVTRDYPKEIVAARQRLMPRFRTERQNGHRVSIEYPARLVVNGKTVADEFPDWYQTLEYDRFQLSRGHYQQPNRPQPVNVPQTTQSTSQGYSQENVTSMPVTQPVMTYPNEMVTSEPVRPPVTSVSYAQVAATLVQQQHHLQTSNEPANVQPQATTTFSTTRPVTVPRYAANTAASQGRQYGSTNTTPTTANTTSFTTTTSTGNYSPSMNLNSNGTGPRDTRTFMNL